MQTARKFDFAQFYYWTIALIEPANPDDDRYVMLHGDEGEVLGPMTMRLAEQWLALGGIPLSQRNPQVT